MNDFTLFNLILVIVIVLILISVYTIKKYEEKYNRDEAASITSAITNEKFLK